MPNVTLIIPREVQIGEAHGAPTIYNKIPRESNIRLKMHIHRLNLCEGVRNLNLEKKLCWNQ